MPKKYIVQLQLLIEGDNADDVSDFLNTALDLAVLGKRKAEWNFALPLPVNIRVKTRDDLAQVYERAKIADTVTQELKARLCRAK